MTDLADHVTDLSARFGGIGGRWMLHPDTLMPAKAHGHTKGFAYYVAGRGGVLGDVDADVVVSAFGFFDPQLIRTMWERGVQVEGARAAARRYGLACAEWGRQRLTGFEHTGRIAEVTEKLIRSVDVSGLTLFAGWRAESLPDDDAGRCYQLMHVMRELRGSAHIVACVGVGLGPLDAVIATGGPAQAELFGWQGPFPDAADLTSQKSKAESATNEIMERIYAAALTLDETAELALLVADAEAHIDAAS